MASMFRASPWVTYQHPDIPEVPAPGPGGSTMTMDVDIDMDAPQISTLREEATPPPTKKSGSPRKPKTPKLKVPPPEASGSLQWRLETNVRKTKNASGTGAGQDEEEDQLIDDDEGAGNSALPPPSSAPLTATSILSVESTPKKKTATKRKSKKDLKQDPDGPSLKKQATESAVSGTSQQSTGTQESASTSQILVEGDPAPGPVKLTLSSNWKKKLATPRVSAKAPRASTRGRGRGKARNQATSALLTHAALVIQDDAATSEAGYTGTAPSSPGTAPIDLADVHEGGTPDPDNITVAPSSPPPATIALPVDEPPPNLEGIPIPQYPLPSKPFPVQPPIKITNGYAPPMTLDKSKKQVRHWRTANREIRGIAGGRWFAKTWVGEKESEYAAVNVEEKPGALGRLGSGGSASAPVGKGRGKGSKAASAVGSVVPSRAGSPGHPDGAVTAPRPQTKMRILQLAPAMSENGDSDMAPPDS
ncbi:hypothetical protein DFP72DRAFT_899734 [Ephemerocybe angulata]|uniref:Uncharacterized protein n=1 Tax=Ephemerocybe angulata TaxID=980116 RepID=A0A8H6M4E1_9AGAR|nr:hypothetical protein DFP72DRAFT_899734 [Tulosesus angulatus]